MGVQAAAADLPGRRREGRSDGVAQSVDRRMQRRFVAAAHAAEEQRGSGCRLMLVIARRDVRCRWSWQWPGGTRQQRPGSAIDGQQYRQRPRACGEPLGCSLPQLGRPAGALAGTCSRQQRPIAHPRRADCFAAAATQAMVQMKFASLGRSRKSGFPCFGQGDPAPWRFSFDRLERVGWAGWQTQAALHAVVGQRLQG